MMVGAEPKVLEALMAAPLSRDLRERIVRSVAAGSSARQAAVRFAVSPSTAIRLMQRLRQTGSAAPAKFGGYRRPILAAHAAELRRMTCRKPDITLAEIQAELARLGVSASLSTIHLTLRRLGLRHKKRA
jgi:transposase